MARAVSDLSHCETRSPIPTSTSRIHNSPTAPKLGGLYVYTGIPCYIFFGNFTFDKGTAKGDFRRRGNLHSPIYRLYILYYIYYSQCTFYGMYLSSEMCDQELSDLCLFL